ncbi:MAG: RHS repeat protein [Lachnospiraceae bacterium]|nr:RHS repeat protein [Lachnospiraceae bacterium]
MNRKWKRIPAIALSAIMMLQSIFWDGIHFNYYTFAEECTTTYSYYENWQLRNVTRDSGESISYEYDPSGNTNAVIDALGNKTTYVVFIKMNPILGVFFYD